MDDNISVLIFKDNFTIISQIERITPVVIGEPDVRLIEPFVLEKDNNRMLTEEGSKSSSYKLSPWLIEYTNDNDFFVHSDKIIVSMNPNNLLKHLYKEQLKKSTLMDN